MSEFVFQAAPWELALDDMISGGVLSAARFLTLMEGEEEAVVEEALLHLQAEKVLLDVTDLPKAHGTGEAAARLRREEQLVDAGKLMQSLEETDPLRLYLEELAQIPACGDVALLAQRLLAGDKSVVEQLTALMLSRVLDRACQMVGRGVLLQDLIQEGSLGLWEGILSYEGGDIEAHCDWYIRSAIGRLVTLQARSSGVGQKLRQAMEDYRAVDERLLGELGRNPTLEEIGQALHMAPEEAATVAKMLESARVLAQAKKVPEPEEETAEDQQAVEDTAYFQMRQRIADLLSDLDAEDARLLTLRFGLEGGKPLSPEETGRKLGLTPEEVVAREGAALAKLRGKK
ncbi:MAG: sigma-70 family RNA polymerase sigma factor [Oscillospiraceae bacterium]|nr:sigma-70 family RNA polymerase sigma factor [Oscillospiraceae bacterium]